MLIKKRWGICCNPVTGSYSKTPTYCNPNRFAKVDSCAGILYVQAPRNPGNYRLMHSKQHKFKQPAKPLEPPTPRTSVLGLDRLAKEKREASALGDGDRKRQKLDSEKLFKGATLRDFLAFPHPLHHNSSSRTTWTPSRTLTTTRERNAFAPGRFIRGWQEETRGVPAEPG